ncbi:MAG TPA: hypothetical protein VGJ13_16520 [Pseudonocardiaceae bacterium]
MRGGDTVRLLGLLAGFAVTGYVAVRLFAGGPWGVGYWFLGGAVLHDLVLFPVYAVADFLLVIAIRRHPRAEPLGVPWINHVRFPVVISGILLLVWSPIIFRLPLAYPLFTGQGTAPYLGSWLAITGGLFAISATGYALRLGRARYWSRPA